MAASLGLNPEAFFFNPCPSYLASSSPFMADHVPSFPFPACSASVDAAFSSALDDHQLFDFEYSPAASVFPDAGGGDDHSEQKMRYGDDDEKRQRVNGRIGFRMRSEVEVLDDGFKWRKYGKKAVKNSPNPRNYYRCSADGCGVKKRVERDRDDPRYVTTTYDSVHNHASPAAVMQYGGGGVGFYSPQHSGSPPAAASYSSGSLLF